MPQKMLMGLAAALVAGSLAQTAGAEEYRPRPVAHAGPEAEIYAPIEAMTYAVGPNGFSGFFQQVDGKCALTLVLYKLANPDEEIPDKFPARVHVSIRPGENARVAGAEGDALQLSCNANAGTVSVSRQHNRSEPVTADIR
jgi:hypothetical protein